MSMLRTHASDVHETVFFSRRSHYLLQMDLRSVVIVSYCTYTLGAYARSVILVECNSVMVSLQYVTGTRSCTCSLGLIKR
jgi:hypothetical protein